jgi:NAD(P)-dependent dehydrogenase (short-subunit alcohol dehydrogenase family)
MKELGVAIVTGSGKRLGKHIAVALAERGFDIVVTYKTSEEGARETKRSVEALGRRAFSVQADISVPTEVARLVSQSMDRFHKVDVLVNNAGIFSRRPWDTIDLGTWRKFLDTNLTGAFVCLQQVGREMLKQGHGRIINIASIGGIQAWPRHIPYSVSKSGVISLTRCFARALAPTVTVNAIAPGTIIMDGEEDPSISHIPVERIPMRRYGVVSDITSVAVFLSTSATYVTGQVFAVDGGRSVDLVLA